MGVTRVNDRNPERRMKLTLQNEPQINDRFSGPESKRMSDLFDSAPHC